tara:strand:- start:567 stop:881 length:315 start_codon:yes stop_codon:yes gene_type:complete
MHSLKLAGIPKTELEARVIMMFNTHSKVAFSIFTSSNLKRRVEKEVFTCQFGSKKAGAESMIHVMQHMMEQSPDFDVFSADAVKAFYNLNSNRVYTTSLIAYSL